MPFVAIALMIVGGYFVFMNWACLILSLITKKYYSMVPPLGGLLLVIGFALYPALRPYAICGLLLDIGFWVMLFAIPIMLGLVLRSAPWRRIARISGEWKEITFHLSFYRPDYYVIKVSRKLPPGKTGWAGGLSYGQWNAVERGIQLVSHTDKGELPSRMVLLGEFGSSDLRVIESTFSSDDNATEFPPVGVVFHEK